jgi:hypothetical protein
LIELNEYLLVHQIQATGLMNALSFPLVVSMENNDRERTPNGSYYVDHYQIIDFETINKKERIDICSIFSME